MSAPTLTQSYMQQLAERIREISVVELFNGVDNRDFIQEKLALDYQIPLSWEMLPHDYQMEIHLVSRVSAKQSDNVYRPTLVKAKSSFTKSDIFPMGGPSGWPVTVEILAYKLVRGIRTTLDQLDTTVFINLGHRKGLQDGLFRIEI